MRLCEFSKKEVINVSDCKCLGCVCDLKFDECSGQICAMIIKGPPKWFHLVGCDTEYVIDWKKIVRIGPDVILVDICAEKCLRKALSNFINTEEKSDEMPLLQ